MMKIKNILMMMAAGGLLGGCAEVDDQAPAKDPVAITLTATVEGETALPGNVAAWTRADADGTDSRSGKTTQASASHESQICLDFTPKADAPSLGVAVGSSQSDNAAITGSAFAEGSALGVSATAGSTPAGTRGIQETSIANGQTVYLWADKGSAGTYTFLQAWELTSDGSGSLSGSTKYYPSDGAALTFRAVHGNFSSAPTSSTAVSTALTHSVATDQNSGSNYQLSDLMYGEGSGSYQSAGTVAFTHKLSKIEVNLTPGIGITASDIASAVVKVRKVKPTVSVTPSDGTVSSASGTATTITAHRNGTLHEAVLPPQAAPDGVLSVTINGITATIPNAVATFTAGNKYVYNVTCTNKDKRLNPLWYVAENNVKSYNSSTKVVTLETSPTAAGSAYCYSWVDAMGYFSKTGTSYDTYWAGDITDGTTGFKYHLPCRKEWFSIIPSESNVFTADFMPSGGLVSSAQTCIFGYSDATKTTGIADWTYWSTYTTANVRYALRYLGTPYCSAWKYEFSTSTKVLTVTAKLIDYLDKNDATLGTKLSTYMNNASFWTTINEDEGALKRQFYAVGYRNNSNNGGTGAADTNLGTNGYYWSATEASGENARYLYFGSDRLLVYVINKKWGLSVRLFRNEGSAEARVRPKLPIDYIAPYNMQTATSMATDNLMSHSMFFSWNNSTAASNGVGTPVNWSKAKADIQAMIKGTAVSGYHLPTKAEWCSVVAPYYAGTNDSNMGGSDNQRITYKRGSSSNLSETVAWGVTNNNGTYTYDVNQVFYNDYNCPNDAAHAYIGYGLRFKEKSGSNYVNGRYTCAFRYEYKSSDSSVGGTSLTIKVTYVGANTSITISTISNESWWTTADYTVVLPACGQSPYTNGSNQPAGWSGAGPTTGYYWSASASDASNVYLMAFNASHTNSNATRQPGHGFSIRLFKDK